jgi:hypothetical protein
MPSPKSGTAGSIVAPTDATASCDADDADPGAVEAEKAFQRDAQTGKYGTVQVTPHKRPDQQADDAPPDQPPVVKTSWIEIVLVDANSNPVAGESYTVTLPDSSVAEGSLDNNGFARIDVIDPGNCQVTFPNLDGLSWDQQS